MSEGQGNLKAIKAGTLDVYQRQAEHYDEVRSRSLFEKPWLDRFADKLPRGADLLDLGCGMGNPVAGYFLRCGFDVTGVDAAPAMIELAQSKHPGAKWYIGDMRDLPTLGRFQGVYSWDGFFHLSVAEQRAALPQICKLVEPGGALMLTVGTGEGEVTGTIGGEPVYHASLSQNEYEACLDEAGFSNILLVLEDADCLGRSVLLAWDKASPPKPA